MRHGNEAVPKAQSAMEYLMTYGWAILIIAVVLGALYSLGVFNAVNFMPKVPGGGCHVFRPNGAGTSWNVNLVGSCNNALPQYVAQFNGQSSNIIVPASSYLNSPTSLTVSGWVNPPNPTGGSGFATLVAQRSGCGTFNFDLSAYQGSGRVVAYVTDASHNFIGSSGPKAGVWSFIVMTLSGTNGVLYLNGAQIGSTNSLSALPQGSVITQIGADGCALNTFNGSIANVQIYNTSLSANQVQYLYNEGIGGVPISPQYLVGWWPLNGDTTDYSGNNNNGAPTSITFNGTWTGGYNVP